MDRKRQSGGNIWVEKYTQSVLSEMSSEELLELLNESFLADDVKKKIRNELKKRDPNINVGIEDTITEDLSPSATPPLVSTSELEDTLIKGNKYNAVLTLAGILKVIAVLEVIGGLVVGFLAFEFGDAGLAIGIGVILSSIVSAVLFFAIAELIKVFTNISLGVDRLVEKSR